MTSRVVLLLTLSLCGGVAARGLQDHTLDDDVFIDVPLDDCGAALAAGRILVVAAQPGGVESVPGTCGDARAGRERLNLRGVTVSEALDTLVSHNRRYEWRNDNGLIVVRPAAGAPSSDNPLDARIDAVHLRAATLVQALNAVRSALGPWRVGGEPPLTATPQALRTVTLDIGPGTMLDALNGIVRAHGALVWTLSYCGSHASRESATFRLRTFDGVGVGGRTILRPDPCA